MRLVSMKFSRRLYQSSTAAVLVVDQGAKSTSQFGVSAFGEERGRNKAEVGAPIGHTSPQTVERDCDAAVIV